MAKGGNGGGAQSKNNPPTLPNYTFSLAENSFLTETVVGADPDRKDILTYAFNHAGTPRTSIMMGGVTFSIDPATGLITSYGTIDYESANVFSFIVQVTDKHGAIDTGNITINVTDANEYAVGAVSDSDPAVNSVHEGAAPGTSVGITAKAIDPDASNNIVRYALVTDGSGSTILADGPFRIDSTTGAVAVRAGAMVDYEVAATQTIWVKATSTDGSASVKSFEVSIADSNDAPQGTVILGATQFEAEVTTHRSLTTSDVTNAATQFFNANNTHVYEFVNAPTTWDLALSDAALQSLSGVTGHLVTVTSQDEQSFIEAHFPNGMKLSWLAATDLDQEGVWVWQTGPEAGTALSYTNWDTDNSGAYRAQPDGSTGENYLAMGGGEVSSFYGVDTPFKWVDGPSISSGQGVGYIIEYSDQVEISDIVDMLRFEVNAAALSDQDGLGSFSYQWEASSDGLIWNDVDGAISSTFEIAEAEAMSYYRVEIAYIDGGGFTETVVSDIYAWTF